MVKWILSIGIVSLGIAVFGITSRDLDGWSPPEERVVSLHYGASLVDLPPGAQNVRIWIPLATSRDGQEILDREIYSPVSYQLTQDPTHHNEMMYVELKPPFPQKTNFNIRYTAKLSREDYRESNKSKEGELEPYLIPTRLMIVNDEIRQRARETTHRHKVIIAKGRGIYEHVISRMEYNKEVPGWGKGDTARACLLGKGNCTDFHSLFISMALAKKIPARFKVGFTIPDGQVQDIPGYHCWAEFYDPQKGWIPVDASEAWNHPERKEVYFGNFDTNKFLISAGRDIDLVPRQAGSPVNIFFYPYVEVDGVMFDGIETSFQGGEML